VGVVATFIAAFGSSASYHDWEKILSYCIQLRTLIFTHIAV